MANSAHLDRLVRHHVREARLEALHEGRHLESIRSLLGEDARREPRARPPRETRTKCVRRSEEVRRGRERPARDTRRLARGRERVLRATLLPPLRASAGRDRPSARVMARPSVRAAPVTRATPYVTVALTRTARARQMLQITRLWVHHPLGPARGSRERRRLRGIRRRLARHPFRVSS